MKPLFLILAGATLALGCRSKPNEADNTAAPRAPEAANAANPAPMTNVAANPVNVAGVASCQPSAEVSAWVTRAVDLADANGDGNVSRDEAQSAVNFMLGGMFFRADANADGKVTPEEGKKARADLMQQRPMLSALLAQARESTGQSPFQALARVVDVEYGQTLSIEDARAAARGALDDLFRVTDENQDGIITRAEASDASWKGVRALGHKAFAAADADGDDHLSSAELQGALVNAAQSVFSVADRARDGKLSQDETSVALGDLVRRLGIPQPTASR
jgi:hypothetical protein